jgi:hypothetical protein
VSELRLDCGDARSHGTFGVSAVLRGSQCPDIGFVR